VPRGLRNEGWIVSISALGQSGAMALVPVSSSYPGSATLVVTQDGGVNWEAVDFSAAQ
jgi:hypothetical protein